MKQTLFSVFFALLAHLLAFSSLAQSQESIEGASTDSKDFLREVVEGLVKQEELKAEETKGQSSLPYIGISRQNLLARQRPVPLGELKRAVPPRCHPQELTRFVLETNPSPSQFAEITQQYFALCSSYLTNGNTTGLLGLWEFAQTEYRIEQNPLIERKQFHLADGSVVEGYLGLKDSHQTRPWVIVKCGVFCDVTESASTLNFAINLFDQSPFNIIFVSNHTGNNHIRLNQSLIIGGFYEVYGYYELARWLKYESPYRHTVDSIHAAGISLGGSAAMAVGQLSSLHGSQDGQPILNSTTAICPVINLGPTLKDMYAPGIKGSVFTPMTWKYLKKAQPYLNDAQDYLSASRAPSSREFPKMLSDISLRYGRKWDQSSPPGRIPISPNSADDFLDYNQFSGRGALASVPTFAWASFDDHIVNYRLNTQALIRQHGKDPRIGAVGLRYGDHCAFATAYGYGTTSAVLQSFILNHSGSYKKRYRNFRSLPLGSQGPQIKIFQRHLRQWWVARPQTDYAELNYEIFDPTRHLVCPLANPFKSSSRCRKVITEKIPLAELSEMGLQIPSSATEAQILSRYLNGSTRLVDTSLSPIDGTHHTATRLSFKEF